MVTCDACSKEVAASSLQAHREDCPDVEISCTHEPNGCPWKGPRYQANAHQQSCAYEAIRGFFAVHDRKMAALTEENTLLRHKLSVQDGIVNAVAGPRHSRRILRVDKQIQEELPEECFGFALEAEEVERLK